MLKTLVKGQKGNESSNPTAWGKRTLNDDDDNDDFVSSQSINLNTDFAVGIDDC